MSTKSKNRVVQTFGERLRTWAESRFSTLGECARHVGIDQSQFTKYMNGSREPSLDALRRLHAAGVSIDWLLSGLGAMEPAAEVEFQMVDVRMSPGLVIESLQQHLDRLKEEIGESTPAKRARRRNEAKQKR